jgi:hypothetical protein
VGTPLLFPQRAYDKIQQDPSMVKAGMKFGGTKFSAAVVVLQHKARSFEYNIILQQIASSEDK